MKLKQSPPFIRAAKKLLKRNTALKENLRLTLALLQKNEFHPRLKTHKLKPSHNDSWSCSVAYDLRIIFRFVDVDGEEVILLQTIGTHDDVY